MVTLKRLTSIVQPRKGSDIQPGFELELKCLAWRVRTHARTFGVGVMSEGLRINIGFPSAAKAVPQLLYSETTLQSGIILKKMPPPSASKKDT
jgi:hypothetical protein